MPEFSTWLTGGRWASFRLRQTIRLIQAAGWFMLLVALLLTGLFWIKMLEWTLLFDWYWMALLTHLFIAWLHLKRKDFGFIRQSTHAVSVFLAIDYALVILPLFIWLLANGQWLSAVTSLTAIVWAWAPLRMPAGQAFSAPALLNRLTHPKAYEWYVVCRQYWPGVLLVWLLFLGTTVYFAFFVAGIFVLLSLLAAAFDPIAPAVMQPADRLALLRRWRISARSMHLIMLPGYGVLLLFQTDWWPLMLYAICCVEGYLLLGLTANAQAWQPGRQRMYSITLSIFLVTLLVPGGLLATWGMALYNLWRWRK